MKIDLFRWSDRIPSENLRMGLLDRVLSFAIPFNLGLGLKLKKLNNEEALVELPNKWKRRNHVGSTHACALALMGEYAAGLLIARNYSPSRYRMIIAELHVDYFKQGRDKLSAYTKSPKEWPHLSEGQGFVELQTEIYNLQKESVAKVRTRWQIKEWKLVRGPDKEKNK